MCTSDIQFESLRCAHAPTDLYGFMCVYLPEEDVLALAGMRQTALGQYLRGVRWMDGEWVRG